MLAGEEVRALFSGRVGVAVATEPRNNLAIPEVDRLDPAAGQRRRAEFILGRIAARDALTDLGVSPSPIPIGAAGEPVWPDGVVGSIGHASGVALSVVGWASESFGIGIDIERDDRRLGDGALRRVCTRAERSWLESSSDPGAGALVIFGAKEAAYKALAGVGAARLRFGDLSFEAAGPGVLVSPVSAIGAPDSITARHLSAHGFVVVGVQIPRSEAPTSPPARPGAEESEPIDRIRESL